MYHLVPFFEHVAHQCGRKAAREEKAGEASRESRVGSREPATGKLGALPLGSSARQGTLPPRRERLGERGVRNVLGNTALAELPREETPSHGHARHRRLDEIASEPGVVQESALFKFGNDALDVLGRKPLRAEAAAQLSDAPRLDGKEPLRDVGWILQDEAPP